MGQHYYLRVLISSVSNSTFFTGFGLAAAAVNSKMKTIKFKPTVYSLFILIKPAFMKGLGLLLLR